MDMKLTSGVSAISLQKEEKMAKKSSKEAIA
jgi:hypothetical protein